MANHAASRTAERVAGREIIVVQDTSELFLGGRRAKANGYGPVGKGGGTRGLLLHAALALDAGNGAILGLVAAQVWNRDKGKVTPRRSRAPADKESQRWLSVAAKAGAALSGARSITVISDRESDIYEHFAQRPANIELIVRSNWNRKIELESGACTQLAGFVDDLPEAARFSVTIPAAPGRKERIAELALRFSPVTLCKPRPSPAPDLPDTIRLTMVDVREVSSGHDGKPIHWRLLTTHVVTSSKKARWIVDLYRKAGQSAGHAPEKLTVGLHSIGYVADTTEKAAEEFWSSYSDTFTRIGRERGWPPTTRAQFDAVRSPAGALLVGSPEAVAEKILRDLERHCIKRRRETAHSWRSRRD